MQTLDPARTVRFPEGFVFGGATAAYQCEGETRGHGKGKVAWDDFLEQPGKEPGDPASDFYHRYPVDLELCEQFGINAVRVSISWARIFPEGPHRVNREGVQFYHDLFAECRRRGVEPFVTLHHFDSPLWVYDNGDFLNRANIDAYLDYARFCFAEYADQVSHWFTFNEVWSVVQNMYVEGTWPGAVQGRLDLAFQAMHNIMVAHARAVVLYKKAGYEGQIGVVHAMEYKYPDDPLDPRDVEAARNEHVLQNQFVCDATFLGHYGAETLEVVDRLCAINGGELVVHKDDLAVMGEAARLIDDLGMNYYQSRWCRAYDGANDLHHNGTGEKGTSRFRLGGVSEHVDRPDVAKTDWDWAIWPRGLFDLLIWVSQRYPNYQRIFITENGMGCKDQLEAGTVEDDQRIDYIEQHLRWIARAIECGVNVEGYFVWSLMDMFSWNNGYNKRYGLFYVDFETQERLPKKSARWFSHVAQTRRL